MAAQPRALISTHDKTGVTELAVALSHMGWELLASGGTAAVIASAGLAVTDVGAYTGALAMLDHRVVTLHPKIHAGILADRDNPKHLAEMQVNGIDPIDLVVVNLYPFVASPGIETIDIGGPAMLRAAAKNHAHVGVVVEPGDYPAVLSELAQAGHLSAQSRRRLARNAFAHTAAFDAAIADWLDEGACGVATGGFPSAAAPAESASLPEVLRFEFERAEVLRYGENPHQGAARYRRRGSSGFFDAVTKLAGPDLSYLNLMDVAAAWRLAHDLGDRAAAVVVKHGNPCGVAVAGDLATAVERAFQCDPRSAFGGVVAVNGTIDAAIAMVMVDAPQADVVIAVGYEGDSFQRLTSRRASTRLLRVDADTCADGSDGLLELRTLEGLGGDLVAQTPRVLASEPGMWKVVTTRQPTEAELQDAILAWRVCAHTSSNAVVLARHGTAVGIGAGQSSRVEAAQIAANKAAGRASGGACASDAFFPFPDGVHIAADAGAAVVVQPGGSVNDSVVIAAADERKMSMLFTSERQFRH